MKRRRHTPAVRIAWRTCRGDTGHGDWFPGHRVAILKSQMGLLEEIHPQDSHWIEEEPAPGEDLEGRGGGDE